MIKETNINERDAIPSDDVQVEDEEFINQILQTVDDINSKKFEQEFYNIQNIHDHTNFQLFNFQPNDMNIIGLVEDVTSTPEWETTWKKVYEK